MKQKLYILGTICFLLIATINLQSQDRRNNFEFGLKAGVNVSNVWDSKDQEFTADPKAGIAAGAFLGIPLGKIIGLQPEFLISQKGFKGSGILLGSPYTTSRTTTYIDVPLQLQLKPAPFITLLGGPQFSYLLKQKDKYTFGSNSSEQAQEFENENIKKNILGFVTGVDLIFSNLVLSGRVGWDLQTNHGDGTSSTPRYKNQWLQMTIGFKI